MIPLLKRRKAQFTQDAKQICAQTSLQNLWSCLRAVWTLLLVPILALNKCQHLCVLYERGLENPCGSVRDLTHRVRCNADLVIFSPIETFRFFLGPNYVVKCWQRCIMTHTSSVCIELRCNATSQKCLGWRPNASGVSTPSASVRADMKLSDIPSSLLGERHSTIRATFNSSN